MYNEACHDMYQKGAAVQAVLPVYEDDMEGYMVGGRCIKSGFKNGHREIWRG